MLNQTPLPISVQEDESDIAALVDRPEWRSNEIKNMPKAGNIPVVLRGDEPVYVTSPVNLPTPFRPSQEEILKNMPHLKEEE